MRLKAKLNGRAGFSLAETLLAVLILLLVSVIVANGIPVARNVYNKVIVGANANVALSTAISALRNELGTAQRVKTDGTAILYYKSSIGAYSKLTSDDTGGIQVQDYVDADSDGWDAIQPDTNTLRSLITSAAANKNLIVTYESVGNIVIPDQDDSTDPDAGDLSDDDGGEAEATPETITINTIQVKRENGDVIASLDTLTIRLIPISS